MTEIYFGERPAEEFHDLKNDPSQLNNLIADPKLTKSVERHRKLLAQWLAKGDAGEGEESNEELAFQGGDQKWGRAVNPEYEVVRKDSDGDGLSDAWETINDRDPADGRLLFTFDCGGWQTEGWKAVSGDLGNIAGRQGFLDFYLPNGKGAIVREGLKLNASKNQGELVITLRTSSPTTVSLAATGKTKGNTSLGVKKSVSSDDFTKLMFPLSDQPAWNGVIRTIQLRFDANPRTLIEIDSITLK